MFNINDRKEFVGQLIDTVEDFLTKNLSRLEGDEDNAIIVGDLYDELSDSFEATLANWDAAEEETPEKSDMDFYIGSDVTSGIYAKNKKEFFAYLHDLIAEAEERGDSQFDICVM